MARVAAVLFMSLVVSGVAQFPMAQFNMAQFQALQMAAAREGKNGSAVMNLDEDIWTYHPHATPFEVFVSLMVGFGLPIAVAVWVIKKFGDARESDADFQSLLG
mmetsp:Transcript_125640/g.221223  ORF Transcript_125640/g.221223 Transcript_125640/m.221223 type:complete len:104 (+) Transcript_125640:83-394(+)